MNTTRTLLTFLAVAAFSVAPTSASADADHVSKSPPIWTYAAPPPAGMTKLIRTPQGLTAQFRTTGLTAGHAVTLWIMFFDNPEACANSGACDFSDIGAPGVRFDFHYASGHIVNNRTSTLSGHVQVGELSTSGFAELVEIGGAPSSFVTALTNPLGAQVILALHSHGPAQSGETLVEQMSSYLGGCQLPFLGEGGFASSADDIPAAPGECSTIQLAFHAPAN